MVSPRLGASQEFGCRLDNAPPVAKSNLSMSSDRPWRHFLLAFLLAGICYAALYAGCEARRKRNGPWVVTFTNSPSGYPVMLLSEYKLAITNQQIQFPDQPMPPQAQLGTWTFDKPQPTPFSVPFGQCVFMDTTFLPGNITFEMFGHQIQLLPRVLTVDHQEHPWFPEDPITLHPVPGKR